jgi:hypothetical protein
MSEPSPTQPAGLMPSETQPTGVTQPDVTEVAAPTTPASTPLEPEAPPIEEAQPTAPSGGLREEIGAVPGTARELAGNIFGELKAGVVGGVNAVLDKLTTAGVYVLKYGGSGLSFLVEVFGPTTLWIPKVALVGAGWGLDKLGSRFPNSRVCRLAKALGEGAWKGGAIGGLTNLAVNLILPPEVKFTMHGTHAVKEAILPTDAAARDIYTFLNGIRQQGLPGLAAQAEKFTVAQAQAVSPEFGKQVAGAIQGGKETVAQVAGQIGPIGPQIDQMTQMAAAGKDQLAQFLTTPVGRIAGIFGIGGLVYKLFGPKKAAA